MQIFYTGVGSRNTPLNVIKQMKQLGRRLAESKLVLRSGAADGADTAFEQGCDAAGGDKQIYLPFKNFNGSASTLFDIPQEAFDIAGTIHPKWSHLSLNVKRLLARDVLQVLGYDLNTPSSFVVCWTPDGYNGRTGKYTQQTGGTGMAVEVASKNLIDVYNLFNEKDTVLLYQRLEENCV